jgi:murein DD-endopeptidase MepM/ murein hydrolase activator NlpD
MRSKSKTLRHWTWLVIALACAPWARAGEAPLYRLPYPEGQAYVISQALGGINPTHTTPYSRHAVDFRMPPGTPVLAARAGVVIGTEWRYEAGAEDEVLLTKSNMVRVRHADGSVAIYAHLQRGGVAVAEGETLEAGRLLGLSGSTGFASGPHLHFAVTRVESTDRGAAEISLPVRFYTGDPPLAFEPRVGLAVVANYAGPAVPLAEPRAPPRRFEALEGAPPREVSAAGALVLLGVCLLGLSGMLWFYRFSRG